MAWSGTAAKQRGQTRSMSVPPQCAQLESVAFTGAAQRGQGLVDLVEDPAGGGKLVGNVLPHSGVLRPLPGKDECGVVFHDGADDTEVGCQLRVAEGVSAGRSARSRVPGPTGG